MRVEWPLNVVSVLPSSASMLRLCNPIGFGKPILRLNVALGKTDYVTQQQRPRSRRVAPPLALPGSAKVGKSVTAMFSI